LSFNHEGNLLAGVGIGVHLYDLESETWKFVFNSDRNTIAIEPGFDNIIFGGSSAINRSHDDGYSWEQITDIEDTGPLDFAVLSEDTVYLGATNFIGGGGVYRSIDVAIIG